MTMMRNAEWRWLSVVSRRRRKKKKIEWTTFRHATVVAGESLDKSKGKRSESVTVGKRALQGAYTRVLDLVKGTDKVKGENTFESFEM